MNTKPKRPALFTKPKLPKPPKCTRRVKKKVGDVIEIPTSKGFAYVQYTHEHNGPGTIWGSLVRVLQGFYKERIAPKELEKIINQVHRFQTFCPVHHSVNKGDWNRVGNFPVPEFAQNFPIFKNMRCLFKRPKPENAEWSLWDGEKSWYVGKMSLEEQMKYPDKFSYNDTGLIHAIETGRGPGGFEKLC